jgi:sn-glycerol 3-phosphate transport system substrate-binding protein
MRRRAHRPSVSPDTRLSRRAALAALAASFAGLTCARERPAGARSEAALWFSYGGKNREVLLALVDRFHAEQAEHRIHAVYQGDYFEGLAKLRTALAANAAPALTHVVGEVVPYLAEAGVLEPLSRFGPTDDLDLEPALAQEGTYLGGGARPLVALPFNRSTPIAYLNGDVLAREGLTAPRTWDELRAFARAATRRTASETARWGFECPVDWWFWAALVGQAGGAVVEADGTPTLGGEAGVRALALWQSLVHDDRTMKPPPGRDYNAWQVANTDFLAGRAAMIWTSTAFLRYLEDNAKFPVLAAPLPRDVTAAVPTGGTLFVMPRGAPRSEQDAAFAFLRWMARPAQANEWATRTGYLPVSRAGRRALEETGYYAAHANDRVAMDQLAVATPWPWATELFRIQREAVQPRLEEAVLGPRDARETLDEARRAAREG